MYNNHHKRMIPKREDLYRTEFPGNYYSSSSVYSYSPTSTSDCPEHGRSRRRTTLILVTSVVLATLGVLSIAGIAAYLGIISKNISNNASQYEESYLQSNTSKETASTEEEYVYGQGRSRHDHNSESEGDPGWIDLTNSLSDTKTGLESKDSPEDLISPHRTNADLSGEVENNKKQESSAEIIKGMKVNLTLASNPIHIAPRPLNVVVTSSSSSTIKPSSSSSPTSADDYGVSGDSGSYGNPVDMIPPPTRENSVSYFTEGSTSVTSFTKPPPRHIRNRHRYPLTNSHSLVPSTTTQLNGGLSNEEDQLGQDNSKNVTSSSPVSHLVDRDRDDISITKTNKSNSNNSGNLRTGDRESNGVIHLRPSDAKESATTMSKNEDEQMQSDAPIILTRDESFNQQTHHESNQHPNVFIDKRLGLADGIGETMGNTKGTAEDDDPRPSRVPLGGGNSNNPTIVTSLVRPDQPKLEKSRVHEDSTPDYFVPITPIVSSERDDSLLNNHKMHLTFDRISPEFYDKNPWTPLLDRPNLDKRPRVDVNNRNNNNNGNANNNNNNGPSTTTSTTPKPMKLWNSADEWAPPDHVGNTKIQPPPHEYYGYGHSSSTSGSSSSSDSSRGDNDHSGKPPRFSPNNRPISHGSVDTLGSNLKQENHDHTDDSVVNPTTSTKVEVEDEETTAGGFRPVLIPSYTVIIPHIPNPPPKNKQPTPSTSSSPSVSASQLNNEEANVGSNKESIDGGETISSVKMDRMGEAAGGGDGDSNEETKKRVDEEEMKNVNGSNSPKNFNDEKTSAEEVKDEDYGDIDEVTVDQNSPTKIYKLDPDTVDIVPDTLGQPKAQPPQSQDLVRATISTSEINEDEQSTSINHPSEDTESVIKPEDVVDPLMKTTTDLIMSTLGSLNLIKNPGQQQQQQPAAPIMSPPPPPKPVNLDLESSPKDSDIGGKAFMTEAPLFPPVRSYVGVNLPLRPKPTDAYETTGSGPSKQLRLADEDSDPEPLRPDLSTTASLHKVMSMMMEFAGSDETSRDLKDTPSPSYVNVTKQNVLLVLKNTNGSLSLVNEPVVGSSIAPPPSKSGSYREQKSFSDRESKIDEQFLPMSNVEHVPVPLIVTERPEDEMTQHPPASKLKISSVKVNDKNSPVYKFVLKKGQSVEDLLKEIFHNYTDVLEEAYDDGDNESSGNDDDTDGMMDDEPQSGDDQGVHNYDAPISPPHVQDILTPHHKNASSRPSSSSSVGQHSSMGSMKSLDESVEDPATTLGISSTTVKINQLPSMRPPLREPLLGMLHHPSTSDPPPLQTVTSIVINEELHISEDCPTNSSFKCVSTGRCIPSYLRCNFIKECPDNSDEENCSCADFLKANGNGRKLCDGVVDCADASDEYEYCEYCQPGQYICAGSRTCINKTQICDSRRDCQNGDDENECVKIGRTNEDKSSSTELEVFSSTYHKTGQLMVRKRGVWGKLCVETFSSVVSHWEVKDLARAVCKALTFSDFESVERVHDTAVASTQPYYELFYGVNTNDTEGSNESSETTTTPRPGLGFRKTECRSKLVVNVTCQDLQCGTAPRSYTQTARIVGGANSMPGKWPWQAALYKNGEYQCGATLISSRWLLSAGHCFYHAQDDHWVARLGTLRRGATVLSPYEQVVRITHIFLHPQYKDVGFVNDVSLLRLENEVNFTDYVRPVCLPSRDTKIRDGRMCTVVGWGQLFEVGRVFPDTLQEVQLPLISTAECRKRTLFLPLYKLTDQMFCAGFDRGGRDACLGDSGGPLMCHESDGRWSLYGVTSNGYGCARANRPGVYTKVASYLDWIYEKMSQEGSFVYRDKSKPCPGHRCLLGECLDKRQVCNGIRDCIEDNGSDERGPNCTFSGRTTNH